jgi:threonine synthase
VKVGLELRRRDLPLICIETALPAKFNDTIREALGRDAERPAAFAELESRPQRVAVLPPDIERVKAFIAAHAVAA